MRTLKRICIKDFETSYGDLTMSLKRGKEYITSATVDGDVCVFTNVWGWVSADLFAGEIEFTGENK